MNTHRKNQTSAIFITLAVLAGLLLASCNGTTGAPALSSDIRAWVEYPYDGATLPMGPVPLVVYASATDGISYIHIKVNGESLPAVAANTLTADGSSRLVRVDYVFTPPAEGEYRVEAAGVNSAGAAGGSGSTRFCIVTCDPNQSSPSSATGTPAPAFIVTDASTPFITVTATSFPLTEITPPTIAPPTDAPPTIAPPPSDTSGPSILSVDTFWYPESCRLFGTAVLSDPSGVTWAEFWFNLNNTGWAWIQMNESGGRWTSQVGVDTLGAAGTLEYKVRTEDGLNNESWSGVYSRNFAYCGD